MARVVFYGKPGCRGNARQRALLVAAGHAVEFRDLLATPWSAERLLAFLGPLPVAEWFNRSAPALKSGEVVPENLGFEAALRLLLADPLLIRRPLLEAGGERRVGFDPAALDAWIGLNGAAVPADLGEGCAAGDDGDRCATPAD
ncbi:ArsC/Spx/MgsR family protein [Azospira restricta]|uniref:Nitrogenase-associated protein n=1 Tax=Azospira restricta TaxID=404405 RepID=A0A974SRH6_9RHOO|nr:ArsC/Spx/MgsR family protein [Azospira restricta]QRJ64993.1 hypothetical protein IWH25_06530 [Azospira restricta]